MIEPRPPLRTVDRVRFAYDPTRGFAVAASSAHPADRQVWEQRLAAGTQVAHPDRPWTSLAYRTEGNWAAVLHRRRGAGDWRTDECLALVGPARTLTARTALTLHDWAGWDAAAWQPVAQPQPEFQPLDGRPQPAPQPDGWSGPSGWIRPLPAVELALLPAATPAVPFRRHDLVALVAALLAHPNRPLSVHADQLGTEVRIALLRSLLDVLEDLLYARARRRPWTFSTFEPSDDNDVARLPRILFLPSCRRVAQARPPLRGLVRLPAERDLSGGPFWGTADALVGRYLDHGFGAMIDWLDQLGVLGAEHPADRVRTLVQAATGRPADGQHRPGKPGRGQSGPEKHRPVRPNGPRTEPGPDLAAVSSLRRLSDVELVGRLNPNRRGPVAEVLAEIRRRHVARDAERAGVRQLLLARPAWCERAGPDIDVLVRFAIDPADLHEGVVAWEISRAIGQRESQPALAAALHRHAQQCQVAGVTHLGRAFRAARQLRLVTADGPSPAPLQTPGSATAHPFLAWTVALVDSARRLLRTLPTTGWLLVGLALFASLMMGAAW